MMLRIAKEKIVLNLLLIGAVVVLAACDGSESTVFPDDGRQQSNPINNQNNDKLTGRALDGYLRNAFVWLDINENGQWDQGEPATETTAGGHFELDVTSLQRDATVGPDLEPRDYPLLLLAVPGTTIDEHDGQPVEKGYLLMAPPGVNVITPFTTLIEFERRLPGFLFAGTVSEKVAASTQRVKARLGPQVSGFSLQVDYLRGDNPRAAAYGRAITAFLEAQTRESWSNELASGNRNVFDDDLINILGGLTLAQVSDVIAQTTALLDANGVDNFDAGDLVLPRFGLEDNDPYVIQRQRLYVDRLFTRESGPEDANLTGSSADLAGFSGDENLSAELSYFYNAAGRLVRVDVRGWTDPSLVLLHNLIKVRGQVSLLDTQYSPGLLVRYSRADDLDDEIDERYLFNWEENRIEWDTTNPEYGSAVTEVDGTPEQVITWESDGGRVTAIERSANAALQESLEIEYAGSESDAVSSYQFSAPGSHPSRVAGEQTWMWDAAESTAECDRINVFFGTGSSGEEDRRYFDTYSAAGVYDSPRLLNVTRTVNYAGAAEPVNVEWVNTGFGEAAGTEVLDSRQPKLLQERVLYLLKNTPTGCSIENRGDSGSALAVSQYDYSRLSFRLSGQPGIE